MNNLERDLQRQEELDDMQELLNKSAQMKERHLKSREERDELKKKSDSFFSRDMDGKKSQNNAMD